MDTYTQDSRKAQQLVVDRHTETISSNLSQHKANEPNDSMHNDVSGGKIYPPPHLTQHNANETNDSMHNDVSGGKHLTRDVITSAVQY